MSLGYGGSNISHDLYLGTVIYIIFYSLSELTWNHYNTWRCNYFRLGDVHNLI